jgi:lipopolysaccharide/colanic/teichoic acid biosynthesis glycosyltransferase
MISSRDKSEPIRPASGHRAQRVLDVAIAAPLLIPALPVVAIAAVAVKLTSPGPAFYSQTRCGRGGVAFTIRKLRSMRHNCEAGTGAQWSPRNDPRVTSVGRWLRKLHIDELPQLINVLKGEMSLVGPRPERPEFIGDLAASIPHYTDRLTVRPGITGLAQIQQPPDVTPDCVRRKLMYDRRYIQDRSLATDVRILFGTALYLAGCSYDRVRRLAGLNTPVLPDEVISVRMASSRAEPDAVIDRPQGVTG